MIPLARAVTAVPTVDGSKFISAQKRRTKINLEGAIVNTLRSIHLLGVASVFLLSMATSGEHAQADQEIHGWGKLEDSEGDARVVQRGNGVEMSVPGVYRDIWPGVAVNAPRLVRRVSGDFAVQVKVVSPVDVTGKTLTAKRPAKARFLFRAACLLVWHDEKNFVRLERSSSVSRPHRWSYQAFDRGRRAASQAGEVRKEGESWLRIQRKDGVVYAWYRQAGDEAWTAMEAERLSLPDVVTVGVAILNTTSDPFMVRFESFVVEE